MRDGKVKNSFLLGGYGEICDQFKEAVIFTSNFREKYLLSGIVRSEPPHQLKNMKGICFLETKV